MVCSLALNYETNLLRSFAYSLAWFRAMFRTAKQIYTAIKNAKAIILVPHPNPDGDALGSVGAMMQLLRTLNKNHAAFCTTAVSPRLRFLPHSDYITADADIWQTMKPDLVMVFDSGDLRYAGVLPHLEKLQAKPKIIDIDHHTTNEFFGDLNMVNSSASSTTEVLYNFFTINHIHITREIATCLLTGLLTDTDNFTNAATSRHSLEIGSALVRAGADSRLIRGWVFRGKSLGAMKMWGKVLSRLTVEPTLNIIYTYVTQHDLAEYKVSDSDVEGVANLLNSLSEGIAALVLKEQADNKIKGSFRTTRDDIDVSAWAKALGGGGHKKAAGFTVDGTVAAALEKVFAAVKWQ